MTAPSEVNVALYRSELLAGLNDDWILPQRERRRARYIERLLSIVQHQRAGSDYAGAIDNAGAVFATEPRTSTPIST